MQEEGRTYCTFKDNVTAFALLNLGFELSVTYY